jgi:general secretion pathway protein G
MLQREPKQLSPLARAAFTLMEMMVVVAILVVLVGVAVPIYLNYLENSKITRARVDIETISNVIESYYYKHDTWPQDLSVLVQPQDGTAPLLKPGALVNPWGQAYQTSLPNVGPRNNGQRPDVFTVTPNGREIGNWQDVRESK